MSDASSDMMETATDKTASREVTTSQPATMTAEEMNARFLGAIKDAKLTRPTAISDAEQATPEMLHLRMQALEAIVMHLIETYHPDMSGDDKLRGILDRWATRSQGPSEVIDQRAFAR